MATSVRQAKELHDLLMDRSLTKVSDGLATVDGEKPEQTASNNTKSSAIGGGVGCFLINHSANYRPQARAARALIESGKLGTIRHGRLVVRMCLCCMRYSLYLTCTVP